MIVDNRQAGPMDIKAVMRRIPHRYPMVLVDRILELELGRRIVGLKNVSANEPYFVGHFPGHPIMPGVLIVESMAQVGGVLASLLPGAEGKLAYLAAIERVRFRRPVVPGNQLITEVSVIRLRDRNRIGKMRAIARVDREVVADGVLMYAMVDLEEMHQELVAGQIVDLEAVEP
jgi:3-hydroxyacyl-[acyl-carrier-protein] dehydratase